MFLVTLTFSACKKKKALNDLDGTWTIQSVTIDGAASPISATGSWIFEECKRKENKKLQCEGKFDYVLEYQGSTEDVDIDFIYQVISVKNGVIELRINEAIYNVEIAGTTMTATFFNGTDNHVFTLVR